MASTVSPHLPTPLTVVLALFLWVFNTHAAPPDLTTGDVPADSLTINLGPTGMRGWIYHVRDNTSESRQIQVKSVASGSPANGKLAANDVILGASGTGASPRNFTSDARKSFANAINDAEARDPAILKLIRWRAGATSTVEVALQSMGAYSSTAPYDCPKSALILQQGLQAIMAGESAGRYSFSLLTLLAGNTNNPNDSANVARMDRAKAEARARIPNATTRAQMMSDQRDATSMVTWERGHTLVALAEYYLVTRDTQILPAVEAYAVNIAKNTSLFGTVGHIFTEKFSDGSPNGPMGGVYGPVNSTGMTCFLGLLLARECGLSPGVPYSFTVMARDKSPARNETTASAPSSIDNQLTLANVTGLLQTDAEFILTSSNLALGRVTTAYNASTPAGRVISQTPAAASMLNIFSTVDLVISLGNVGDYSVISPSNMVDDRAGAPLLPATPVTYTLTFTQNIDATSIDATDFSNAGNSPITIGAITATSSRIFTLLVTPTSPGTLRLQISAGAVIRNSRGTPLNTSIAIGDDTVLMVSATVTMVPELAGLDQSSAGAAILAANLLPGAITTQYDAVVPAGHVRSQNPDVGVTLVQGSSVDFVVSLGRDFAVDYATWVGPFAPADLGDPQADFDNDGLSNQQERIWGLDPTRGSSVSPITVPLDPATRTFSYTRRAPALTGLTIL